MDGYQHPYMYNSEGSCERRASWYPGPPTYHVNAANVALLPNQTPLYRPSINQSVQSYSQSHTNQYGIARTESTQDAREAAGLGLGWQQSYTDTHDTMTDISIRVINPKKKRDAKTYILKDIQPQKIRTPKCLRKEILEQLGKSVVSFQLNFDVGYMSGNQRICLTERQIGSLFPEIAKDGSQLWCEGIIPLDRVPSLKRKRSNTTHVVIDDSSGSDDDTELPPRKQKPKRSAMDEKAERVQKLADKLQAKHGDTYNKIQYKLWAEAMDVNKHKSMERPPPGTIWGTPKESRRAQSTSEAMSEAFTNMATTLVTAFNKPTPSPSSPISNKGTSSIQSEVGVSPGRLADLQGKFFTQIEQLHKLFDCGALSKEQFEKRKQVILDRLDELASK